MNLTTIIKTIQQAPALILAEHPAQQQQELRLWKAATGRLPRLAGLAILAHLLVSVVWANEHLVDQKNKKFSVSKLNAKVGDTVKFTNSDPFAHNVYSLSDTQSFDLGSYRKNDTKSLVLNKPGKIEVECSIHTDMNMVIEVTK